MDAFLAKRGQNPRFQNERRVSIGDSSTWYLANPRTTISQHTFSEYKSGDTNHKMTPHKDDNDSPKKKKRKKEKGEFSESKKKELSNRTSSDDSDAGPCWSDYERTPGTKAGEKGSCRPKGGKKD